MLRLTPHTCGRLLIATIVMVPLIGVPKAPAQTAPKPRAVDPLQGTWGLSPAECADLDNADQNMVIQWPWVKRNERVCRRKRSERNGAATIVEFDCERDGQNAGGMMRFTPIDRDTIVAEFTAGATGLSGKEQRLYRRCTAP